MVRADAPRGLNVGKVRVCTALESTVVPAWVARLLRELRARPFVELSYAIGRTDGSEATGGSRLYRLYEQADRWWYAGGEHSLEPTPVGDLLDGVPCVDLEAEGLEDLDLWIWLVPGEIPGRLAATARHGVWAYRLGDGSPRAPYLRELSEGNPLATGLLEGYPQDGGGPKLLYRSCAATHLRSLDQTRREAFWKASSFVLRRLDDMCLRGWDPASSPRSDEREQARGQPSALEMLGFLVRMAGRIARSKMERVLFHGPYLVALGPRAQGDVEGAARSFAVVQAPRGRFYADPFLVAADQRHYLFVEDADARTGRAIISCMEILSDGSVGAPRAVLERAPHVSYPFVFRWADDYFMVPETVRSRTIELYRAVEFPWRWERVKILFEDVAAVDTTLFDYGGRTWLFTAMSECGGSLNDELFLFHADSPLGEWTPHPMNPVVSDVRRARPAGSIYAEGGRLIRPAQDCSRIYGGAIVLNSIDVLTETEYREHPLRRIDPTWRSDLLGTHTINHSARFTVVDGKRRVPKWQR